MFEMIGGGRKTREWIMLYGESQVGKSYRVGQLLEAALEANENCNVWILDTDSGFTLTAEHFPVLKFNSRVKGDSCSNWYDTEQLSNHIMKNSNPGDWIVIDRATPLWKSAAKYFVEKELGISVPDIERNALKAARNSGKRPGNAILEFYSPIINPSWHKWEDDLLYQSDCNVICTCGEKKINDENDRRPGKDKHELIAAFESIGLRPDTQGDSPFKYHTVMHLARPYGDVRQVTTLRERGKREPWYKQSNVKHLGYEYLLGTAGYGA